MLYTHAGPEVAVASTKGYLTQIVACYLVSGSYDFLAEVAVPDLASYERLLLGQILTIPSIVEAQSTFAIRTILSRGPLPLDHWRR